MQLIGKRTAGLNTCLTCYSPHRHYVHYVCSCGLSLFTWNASEASFWTLRLFTSSSIRRFKVKKNCLSVTAEQGFHSLAGRTDHHILSIKLGQWSILHLCCLPCKFNSLFQRGHFHTFHVSPWLAKHAKN